MEETCTRNYLVSGVDVLLVVRRIGIRRFLRIFLGEGHHVDGTRQTQRRRRDEYGVVHMHRHFFLTAVLEKQNRHTKVLERSKR